MDPAKPFFQVHPEAPSRVSLKSLLGPSFDSRGTLKEEPAWARWGTPLDAPRDIVTAFRKSFAGGADCPTESYCSFRGTAFDKSLKAPGLNRLQAAVKAWSDFNPATCKSLPASWKAALPSSVCVGTSSSPKTLLMAIQGRLIQSGAILLPWHLVSSYFGPRDLADHLMHLCGAQAVRDATAGADDFSFAHFSTFMYPDAAKELRDHTDSSQKKAWAVVSIKKTPAKEKRLLGFITVVAESSGAQDRHYDAEYHYGVTSRIKAADPGATEAPWNLTGSVWNRVLANDPTGSMTGGYSKNTLYIEKLCAAKSSVKNVGKLLLLWALGSMAHENLLGTYLELGFLGPAWSPGITLKKDHPSDKDFACITIPSTYAASVYHQVFKYQRLFSLCDEALEEFDSYIGSCIDLIAGQLVDGWLDMSPRLQRQVKTTLAERYSRLLHSNLDVFRTSAPSPYIHAFTPPTSTAKYEKDRRTMVNRGALATIHQDADLTKEPYRFMRYFMYRPYPTETHLRSIFLSL